MDEALFIFIPTILLAAALANISVWSHRRLAIRVSAVLVAAAFIPLAYGSISELLSRPKPVSMEWMRKAAKEAKVMSSSIQEGKAIYVWLQLPELDEPRAYALPWNKEMAKQLQGAQREAAKTKNGVKVAMPFEPSVDRREPMFYSEPQKPPPEKQTDDDSDAPLVSKGGTRSFGR